MLKRALEIHHSKGIMNRIIIILLISILAFTACKIKAPYFQKIETMPQNAWKYNNKLTFKFDITDTTADYQPFFLIQHTQSYQYNNVWVWMYIKMPGDSIIKKERVDVELADPTGKWYGRGMGEIYEQRMPIKLSDTLKFNKPGIYQISLEQNMRINPLPEIIHVGLRVEKVPRQF